MSDGSAQLAQAVQDIAMMSTGKTRAALNIGLSLAVSLSILANAADSAASTYAKKNGMVRR